ncbi:hypothetical protein ACHAXA_006962 [Cyclostephanos tholiformis]|uniref:Uncharacterized protein n=1 Tax=Cyclostephanos tholiformis TaxID=382380 RepID=A0ABD3RXC8_9STRA
MLRSSTLSYLWRATAHRRVAPRVSPSPSSFGRDIDPRPRHGDRHVVSFPPSDAVATTTSTTTTIRHASAVASVVFRRRASHYHHRHRGGGTGIHDEYDGSSTANAFSSSRVATTIVVDECEYDYDEYDDDEPPDISPPRTTYSRWSEDYDDYELNRGPAETTRYTNHYYGYEFEPNGEVGGR